MHPGYASFAMLATMDSFLGRFEHYKGGIYEVLMVATHTETLEPLAIYRAVDKPERIWARPLSMFREWVDWKGGRVPRFRKLDGTT